MNELILNLYAIGGPKTCQYFKSATDRASNLEIAQLTIALIAGPMRTTDCNRFYLFTLTTVGFTKSQSHRCRDFHMLFAERILIYSILYILLESSHMQPSNSYLRTAARSADSVFGALFPEIGLM